MHGIYANIWGILMANVTIYSIHGSYGTGFMGEISIFVGKDVGSPNEVVLPNPIIQFKV